MLAAHGYGLADFGLPDAPGGTAHLMYRRELRLARSYDTAAQAALALSRRATMNPSQALVYDRVDRILRAAEPGEELATRVLVDGAAGTGKTFLFEAVLALARSHRHVVVACAWSGLAAALLPGARTCHAVFGFPVPLPTEGRLMNASPRTGRGELLRVATVIVWDELFMCPARAIDDVDAGLRDLCGSRLPFAGKLVLFGGDPRQTLPVMPRATRTEQIEASARRADALRVHVTMAVTLQANMRASADPEFATMLLAVGNGVAEPAARVSPCSVVLPGRLRLSSADESALLTWVYADCEAKVGRLLRSARYGRACPEDVDDIAQRGVLAPRNDQIVDVNQYMLERLSFGERCRYMSTNRLRDETTRRGGDDATLADTDFSTEALQAVEVAGLPPHELVLAPGCVVVFMRNLSFEDGLINGVRALVVDCRPRVVRVLLLTGPGRMSLALVPRIPMTAEPGELPVPLVRRQLPLRLAWAMTINRAQGQTLRRCGVMLSTPCFAHGQLYVALSRVRRFADVRVWLRDDDVQGSLLPGRADFVTDNVVFGEVLT
jgi:ATP-dependent DNA helicase PIF1